MAYCVQWRLVGLSDRLLDSGRLDDDFEDYGTAVAAIDSFLRAYSEVGRHQGDGYWWARRSPDADIEMQIWVDRLQEETSPGEEPFPVHTARASVVRLIGDR
jgi:hypothetical protein